MKHTLSLCSVMVMSLLITACSGSLMRAPCDHEAHYCGTKTKINNW